MKKTNAQRKLSLNKKVILLLNDQLKSRLIGGIQTETCPPESYTCDGMCNTRTVVPNTSPSHTCTTVPTGACTKG